jgi:hypothetical protein
MGDDVIRLRTMKTEEERKMRELTKKKEERVCIFCLFRWLFFLSWFRVSAEEGWLFCFFGPDFLYILHFSPPFCILFLASEDRMTSNPSRMGFTRLPNTLERGEQKWGDDFGLGPAGTWEGGGRVWRLNG